MSSTTFPAFVTDEYRPGTGFADFEREAQASGERTRRTFETSFESIKRIAQDALSVPRTAGGGLDLGVDKMRQQALAAEATAQATREIAAAFEQAARAEGDFSAATQTRIAGARAAAVESEREAAALSHQVATLEAVQVQLNSNSKVAVLAAGSNSRLAVTHELVGKSAGNARLAQFELMHVVRASSDGMAAGVPAVQLLGMEFGRLAEAAALSGSSLGAVGKFLQGPWGIALQLGIGLLSAFAVGHHRAADGAGEHAKAAKSLEQAISDLNATTKKEVATSQLSEQRAYADAKAQLSEEIQIRKTTAALLDQAKAKAAILLASLGKPGAGDASAQFAAQAQGRVAELGTQLDAQNKAIGEAEQNLRRLSIPIEERRVAEHLDLNTAATGRYERAQTRLRQELERGTISQQQFDSGLITAAKARDKAVAAIRAAEEARQRTARDNRQSGRDLSLSDAEDLMRGIGARITSARRSTAKQAQLYSQYLNGTGNLAARPGTSDHEVGRALDLQGVTIAQVREAFAGQGVAIKQIIPEGDHIHVAWGKMTDAATAAAHEVKELNTDLADLTRQFDPAAAAAIEYGRAIERIARLQKAGQLSPELAAQYTHAAAMARFDAAAAAEDAASRKTEAELSDSLRNATIAPVDDLQQRATDALVTAGNAGAEAFRAAGIDAAQTIADVLGGGVGQAAGILQGMLGGGSGTLGRIIGATTAPTLPSRIVLPFGGSISAAQLGEQESPLAAELHGLVTHLGKGLKIDPGTADRLGRQFGKTASEALQGAAIGQAVAGFVFRGNKSAQTGAQIGGAIGSVAGAASGIPGGQQIGAIVGSIEGGFIGKLLSKPKAGATTLSVGAFGNFLTGTPTGNDAASRSAAVTEATNVATALASIAKTLGGTVTAGGTVSLGYRASDKKEPFRVDPTGQGRSTGNGVLAFATQEEATAKAVQLMLEKGVIGGISAASQRILKSGQDLQSALEKASLIESVPKQLKALTDPVGAALDDLNSRTMALVNALKEGGASADQMADAEKLYGMQRKAAIEQAASEMTSAFKGLIDSLTAQNPAFSLRDRLAAAQATLDPLQAQVAAGDYSHASDFADAVKAVEAIMRELDGSQQGYFDFVDKETALAKTALAGQQALIDAATGASSPFGSAADPSNGTVPAIDGLGDHLGGILTGEIGGRLDAVNDNLGTMIRLLMQPAPVGGGGSLGLDRANF